MDMTQLECTIKEKESSSSTSDEDDRTTNWHAVAMAGLVTFLAAVENTVVGMSEWPYMSTIDPEATTQFFGFVASVSKCGHAFFAIVFAYWSYRIQNTKIPLIVGRLIAFTACCLYLSVEFLPTKRRFLMLFCYFLFGIAGSSSTILRAYIASVSSQKDRARAYSTIVVANMLSIIIGPVCQLAFTSIKYPGIEIITGKLRFHIYSAPIWIASITNFVSIAIVCFGLNELPKRHKTENDNSMFTLLGLSSRLRAVLSLDIVWTLIILCWVQKIVANLAVVTLQTICSPLMMISFGWDGQLTVRVLSICMGLVGVLSISVASSFIFCRVGNFISPRVSFLISIIISLVMYILSYPYSITSHPVLPYNVTTGVGCNRNEYTWCDTAFATWPLVFLPVVCVVMGIGLPTSAISLDTIYSKVLGNIDQSLMQGAIVVAEDFILILGPLYSASMFSASGQASLWVMNGVITMAGIILWLAYFPRLKMYK